jgi:hypothetical protein
MVYRESNPNPCATAAPVRVARSKGYLSLSGLNMSWIPGRRVFRNAIAANDCRRRHPIDLRTRNATPLRTGSATPFKPLPEESHVIYGTGH